MLTDLSECPPRIAVELINCFFLRLPRPLLTRFDDFVTAAMHAPHKQLRTSAIRSLIDLHVTADRSLLVWLLALGVRLHELGFPTHTHQNFALRFAPSVFRQDVKKQRQMCGVLECFLTNFAEIFEAEDVKYMESSSSSANVVHSAPIDRLIDKCLDHVRIKK